tara:strand:- start:3447 stop:4652 length:1206 start_codon:yes stop_codon:yes gene_type:complete
MNNMDFRKKTKSLLFGMEFTNGLRRSIMAALALIYFLSLGFNLVSVTTLFAISGIIMVLFEIPTGTIADYDSRKKSLIISHLLLAIAFLGVFLFTNFWFLAFFWILGDVAWTFSSGVSLAWAIDSLKYGRKKSKIVSLISRTSFFEKGGQIIGGIIGLVVVAINFKFIWLVVSITNLLMMFLILFYLEERNFKPEKTQKNYIKKSLVKTKESILYIFNKGNSNLRILLICGFLIVLSVSSFFIGVPLIFTEVLGLSPHYLAGMFTLFAVVSLITTNIVEKLHLKRGIRNLLLLMALFMGLSIMLFSLSPLLVISIIFLGIFTASETIYSIIEDSAKQHQFSSKIRASLGSIDSISWATSYSLGVFLAGLGISLLGLINTLVISGLICVFVSAIYLFCLSDN